MTSEGETINFIVNVPHNSYFAIGFGTSMTDTDMLAFRSSKDKSKVEDLWSTGHTKPMTDDS